jgi:hypothetical protein
MDNKVDRVEPQPAELPEKPYPEVHHIQNNSSFDQGKEAASFGHPREPPAGRSRDNSDNIKVIASKISIVYNKTTCISLKLERI